MRVTLLIFAVMILNALSWGSTVVISDADYNQEYASIAYDGSHYFVVWQDYRNENFDIYGARVSQEATVLDPDGIPIAYDGSSAAREPAIAFDGNNFLTVWRDDRNPDYYGDIYGARVTQEGQILDPNGFAVCHHYLNQKEPAVTFGDANYLVAWEDERWTSGYSAIYCARVDPLGTVLDPQGICVSLYGFRDLMEPDVAFDGTNYLVVWEDRRYDADIYGARVNQNGQVLDLNGGFPISTDLTAEGSPSVAFDGVNYSVVWHNYYADYVCDIFGTRVTPNAEVLDPEPIPISTGYGYERAPTVAFDGKVYVVTWQGDRSTDLDFDIYGARVTTTGTVLDPSGFVVAYNPENQIYPGISSSGTGQNLIAWQLNKNDQWDIVGNQLFASAFSDDPLALAYNGNRHLVRKPNTEELHLVYTNDDKIYYTHSTNGGANWLLPLVIGEGKYPAIALDYAGLPSVTWTDEEGGLWYRRQYQAGDWICIYHLWDPASIGDLRLNSPPSIAIDHLSTPNIGHILVTRSGGEPTCDVDHTVEDYTFDITRPQQGSFILIEQAQSPYPDPPLRSYPSIARCEMDNSLHGAWQRVDTICYAKKPSNQSWINWGWQFRGLGLQSAHPFVETYGDSIYVVWQHLDPSTQKEEIYRGRRYTTGPFYSDNLSRTTNLVSLHPVNASGFFTAYAEEPTASSPYEIYYKVRAEDDRRNVSNTPYNSLYPQCAARFTLANYLYTAWQDGNEAPYEICFKKIRHEETKDMAYLTSSNGHNLPSPYLVARDSFISDWQIPVDIGDMTTTYQFPLVPGYAYKAKAVVYHEGSGPWSGRIKIDNNLQFAVTYNANVPETLECWIPPALYEDSVLTVSFNRIAGDFAAIGPIYIYRYEYEGGGGPMSQQSQPMYNTSLAVFPNPFTENLNITYQITGQNGADLKLYDVTGRLVKKFDLEANSSFSHIIWDGVDDKGRAVPQGIYFLRIDNSDSGDILCQKVLKVK